MGDDITDRLDRMADIVVHASDTDIFTLAADEIDRLRAAIDAVLRNIDFDHEPEWASDQAKAAGKEPVWCAMCGPRDGSWPCRVRDALDALKEARRG